MYLTQFARPLGYCRSVVISAPLKTKTRWRLTTHNWMNVKTFKRNLVSDSGMAPNAESNAETPAFRMYNDKFLNVKGKKIFCYYWAPENPRALLLINHGFSDHTMMYEKLAQEMVKRRFFVFGHDHAGHGRSEGVRAHVSSINNLVDDSVHHIEKVREKFPSLPLFIWGHSMGGAMTFLTSFRKGINLNGIVSVAPALKENPETATPLKVATAKLINAVMPFFPIAYADVTLCTRNPDEIIKMKKDPLRYHGYCKARSVMSLIKTGEDILKERKSIDVPYLLLHGDMDKVCHIGGSELLHKESPSKDKTFIVYPGAYHSLLQETDEIASDVLNQSIQWLDQRA